MDALQKLNEHFLSCNICTQIFKDPCTIGCYHTFCRGCLTKYTKTRREAISAKSILCPNCKQMTKVPRPEEPVDQWSHQFKPSFLIQGLLDTFTSQNSQDSVQHSCFTCEQFGKTTEAKSACEDCDIKFCETCTKIHISAPNGRDHVISPLGAGSTPQLKKRKVMCKEHNCVVDFCCKDCQKAVCNKCCIVYHRKCNSVVTLESMIPEMKQVLQQNYDEINSYLHQTGNTSKSVNSVVEDVMQHTYSLQSEIRRVTKDATDLIKRKEKKLLDELDMITAKQIELVKSDFKSRKVNSQTYQQYQEFIKQVLQSNSLLDLYDMFTLCRSGEITAEIQKKKKQGDGAKEVTFMKQMDVVQLDKTFKLGFLRCGGDKTNLQDTPKLLSTISLRRTVDNKDTEPSDIEILIIAGMETLVITDKKNRNILSCYQKGGKSHWTHLRLDNCPSGLTKIGQDKVAVSGSDIKIIRLAPGPVLLSSIRTKRTYSCLTALSDTTLAAACSSSSSIDVLDLSGRVLRSVIPQSSERQLIRNPKFMCTTRQGHITMIDTGVLSPGFLYCITQQGSVLYTYRMRDFTDYCGVTTTDTGSVIVTHRNANKIILLTESGEYVRDLLTGQDGIIEPQGICVHGEKLYVTDTLNGTVKIFQW